jgi:hypothetical protein
MKKFIIRSLIALLILIVLAVIGVSLFLDAGIKKGVETVGPLVVKVPIKLDSVSLSLLSGSGKIGGLVVGNPEGYKTPSAISVASASLALQPGSLLSDKIVIKSIKVQGPEITYETDLKASNLGKILDNLETSTGGDKEPTKGPEQPKASKPAKKLQVDEFVIEGGRIHVSVTALGGKSATVPLPPIRLPRMGEGPEGITAAELTKVVLKKVLDSATKEGANAVSELAKGAVLMGKEASKTPVDSAEKVTKGIGDLFKKKQ